MIGLFVGGMVVFLVLAALGIVLGTLSLVFWVVLLPFRLLGFAFRALALLLALPLIVLFGGIGALILAAGLIAAFVPALPIIALVALVWWRMRRRPEAHTAA